MNFFRNVGANINGYIATSTFGRKFRLEGCGHENEIARTTFFREIRAGLTTFFVMVYIISVNASILTDSGGPCVCTDTQDPTCANDPDYNQCLIEINRDFITATSAMAAFASVLFGFLTNLPVALAPGMGTNAYFAYQVVGFHGTGSVNYHLALAAVFIEGWIFVGLSLLGMRQWLVKVIPNSIKVATGAGIGLLLALIGLSPSAGIGAVSGSTDQPLDIAGCAMQYMAPSGACAGHQMASPTMWIGICLGGLLVAYLMAYNLKSAIIIGVGLVSILSWPRDTSFTYFNHSALGDARFEFFKQVVTFHPIQHTLNQIDWAITKNPGQFALALITFLYVDIIDCTGTLYSMARFAGVVDPESGDFPRSTVAYCTDAFSITVGALLGVSPVTAFVESSAGIVEGGRTGLTAITTGLCFFITLFFAPIFASIPPWATGCTLVIVGCMMMRQVVSVNWRYIGDALPAFVTLMFIPFSYSIAYGLIAGMMTYAAINGLTYLTEVVTRGYIVPPDNDHREYWTAFPGGRMPWFVRAFTDPESVFHPRSGGIPKEMLPADRLHSRPSIDSNGNDSIHQFPSSDEGYPQSPTSPSKFEAHSSLREPEKTYSSYTSDTFNRSIADRHSRPGSGRRKEERTLGM